MRYKLLGQSGLRVSELCLGTMTFGEDWGWGASGDESRKIFDRYLEAGGNVIDTPFKFLFPFAIFSLVSGICPVKISTS